MGSKLSGNFRNDKQRKAERIKEVLHSNFTVSKSPPCEHWQNCTGLLCSDCKFDKNGRRLDFK